jgi:hypothetical protein
MRSYYATGHTYPVAKCSNEMCVALLLGRSEATSGVVTTRARAARQARST